MNIYDSKLWISDLDEIIESLPELDRLSGKRVLVTGATGLVCSALVDLLIRWNETHDARIDIYAAGRSRERALERFAPFADRDWFRFVPYDLLAADNRLDFTCDYIVHGASNASPNRIVREPVETIAGNFCGMKQLLDYARERSVARVLYVSSSEVYGKKAGDHPFRPDEYGYVDLLAPRSAYALGKRATETLCAAYADEYGVDSVIVRPGHIYGPTASESDNRVSSAWAYMAARGEDIVMKSDGSQIRSYCYCLDCASAMLVALLKGEGVRAYNISNPVSVISIRDLAELLAEAGGVRLRMELPTEAERKGFNPMQNSSLDSAALMALGWAGRFDARRGLAHTVEILKELGR